MLLFSKILCYYSLKYTSFIVYMELKYCCPALRALSDASRRCPALRVLPGTARRFPAIAARQNSYEGVHIFSYEELHIRLRR